MYEVNVHIIATGAKITGIRINLIFHLMQRLGLAGLQIHLYQSASLESLRGLSDSKIIRNICAPFMNDKIKTIFNARYRYVLVYRTNRILGFKHGTNLIDRRTVQCCPVQIQTEHRSILFQSVNVNLVFIQYRVNDIQPFVSSGTGIITPMLTLRFVTEHNCLTAFLVIIAQAVLIRSYRQVNRIILHKQIGITTGIVIISVLCLHNCQCTVICLIVLGHSRFFLATDQQQNTANPYQQHAFSFHINHSAFPAAAVSTVS